MAPDLPVRQGSPARSPPRAIADKVFIFARAVVSSPFRPTMSADDPILSAVREFIQSNFLYMRPDFVLGDDDQFVQNRVLDSMAVMELVLYMRTEFGVEVPESEILESNLGSLRAVVEYIRVHGGSQETA